MFTMSKEMRTVKPLMLQLLLARFEKQPPPPQMRDYRNYIEMKNAWVEFTLAQHVK